MKQAVIIAAGLGSRLASFTHTPKPLLPVGGVPLLFWALKGAEQAGCQEAVIVLGFRAEEVREYVQAQYRGKLRLRMAYNPFYEKQNGLSVLAARPYVESPFLLLMADHCCEAAAFSRLRECWIPEVGALLVVDSRLEQIADLEDATKVLVREGRVVDIGKQIASYNAVDTGIFLATLDLVEAIAAVAERQGDAALTDGVRELCYQGKMWAIELGEYFWQDVDTPEAYWIAERWARQHRQLSCC
ncbi:MAG: NTP transferase domain-containing protein [Candidatus Kapabacteria bacterium]|nr:NTP transferase domain-containing protein [Candidatus Kapabacteria bacterium]MDW8012698.1 NTP transferase domain-containing protein [Bacteroidota bacterium]